jgi:hypothetical protein
MNTLEIEDRIRAAARAAADTVTPDSVPPLRLPSDRPSRARRRSRAFASAWGRWLAPMAAAAAVVAVAVAMVTVGRTVADRTGGPAPSSRPGPVRSGPPPSSYVAAGRVPRYYVSIESHGNPNFNPSYAVVRATATGAALEVVAPPTGQTVVAATAAADDRTFMLDTQPFAGANSNANQNFEPRTFRELLLSPGGSILSLSTPSVSVPGGQLMTGFALSPDGSKLAVAVQPDSNKREPDLTEVKVITLATGAARIWTANGTIGTGPDDARSLSWTSDERTMAFTWTATGPGIHTGVWLLDLATGGGSLLADSREAVSLINQGNFGATPVPSGTVSLPLNPSASPEGLVQATVTLSATGGGAATPTASPSASASPTRPPVTPPECQLDSIVTPDGSAIVCGAIASRGSLLHRGAETEFIEYSTTTGKVARVLGHWTVARVQGLSVDVLWSNASGSVLIGVIPGGDNGRVGVISGNEFTPLPVSAAFESGAW